MRPKADTHTRTTNKISTKRNPSSNSSNNVSNSSSGSSSLLDSMTQIVPEIEGSCTGYRTSIFKKYTLYLILNLLTLGFICLIGKWYCRFEIYLVYVKCSLQDATIVLIKDSNGQYQICKIKKLNTGGINLFNENKDEDQVKEEGQEEIAESEEEEEADDSSDAELLFKKTKYGPGRQKLQKQNQLVSLVKYATNNISSSDEENEISRAAKSPSCTSNSTSSTSIIRYFEYHEEKFIFNQHLKLFNSLNGLSNITCAEIHDKFNGYNGTTRERLKNIYGSNNITIIIKNLFSLFWDEALKPFYFFQIFSITIWCLDEYVYYASCVLLIAISSIGLSMSETRRQMKTLKDMAEYKSEHLVTVQSSNGEDEEINSADLVPGDILLIPPNGFTMPCDAVLTHGTCIVNECMLTGESIPVHKTPLISSTELYNDDTFKRNTLFCGTQIIQTRFYAGHKASCVVIRTGYSTIKGSLIRSIMFPKEISFSFYQDSIKFVCILFGIAIIAMSYCSYIYYSRHASWEVLLLRVFDILTITVPPALPAAMTIGSYYAQKRLKLNNIFCTSPDRINFAGKLKLLCFDKTGTLTEDGLNLAAVVSYNHVTNNFDESISTPTKLPIHSNLLHGMASCHSLTYVNGLLIGDPLDVKMFESTEWELEEPYMYQNNEPTKYDLLVPTVVKKQSIEMGIVRQFEFTPQLQRMSVVIKTLNSSEMKLYCKGSPEKVLSLCTHTPANYDQILDSFTNQGYRVIAMSWKSIVGVPWHTLQRISRNDIETDMEFAGFIVMQNSLKPVTQPVINKLTRGGLRCVMVTGDNILTALSVAKECNMISAQDQAIMVDVDDDNQLLYKLATHQFDVLNSTIHNNMMNESQPSFGGENNKNEVVQIQIGCDDDEYEEDNGDEDRRTLLLMANNDFIVRNEFNPIESNNMFLDEIGFHRSKSSTLLEMKRNISNHSVHSITPLLEQTYIDMNNHVITIPSTMAIIPVEQQTTTSTASASSTTSSSTASSTTNHTISSFSTSSREQITKYNHHCNNNELLLTNNNYHFVMTGRVWNFLYQNCCKEELYKILVHGTVFARMNPENKKQLVEAFQELGYCVGMCGDGANDCSALKMAHVGISLSEAEASVAAPFTSKICDISCVPRLVLEGRCALVTSFGMFKYMALYSMVQLATVLILYTKGTNLADPQFLFIDLGIITTLAIVMARTHPYTKIVNKRPMTNLLSIQNFLSILLQIFIALIIQLTSLQLLHAQPWYVPVKLHDGDENIRNCWDTTTLFYVSCFQYLALSLAFSKGKPFRKPFYTNWALVILYFIITITTLMIIFPFYNQIADFFQVIPMKELFDDQFNFRLKLIVFATVNIIMSVIAEELVTSTSCFKKLSYKLFGYYKQNKYLYEKVLDATRKDKNWPPIKR